MRCRRQIQNQRNHRLAAPDAEFRAAKALRDARANSAGTIAAQIVAANQHNQWHTGIRSEIADHPQQGGKGQQRRFKAAQGRVVKTKRSAR